MHVRFTKSIGFKVALWTAFALWAVITAFSLLNIRLTEVRLLRSAEVEASKTSEALKDSLERAMLTNDNAWIMSVVEAISKKPMIKDIKIMAPDGTVKWSKDASETGIKLDKTKEKTCSMCHISGEVVGWKNLSVIFEKPSGERILRNANPILNKADCHGCHDPGLRILGKLIVDFTTTDVYLAVEESRKMLMLTAALTLIVAVLLCILLINMFVRTRLSMLIDKMKEVEMGSRKAEVSVKGSDEVALLGLEFNKMINAVSIAEFKIQKKMDEHETLFNISEILNRSGSIDEAASLVADAMSIGFNVEQALIVLFEDGGGLALKTSVGVVEPEASAIREYLEGANLRSRIMEGSLFTAEGSDKIDKFLVVPLMAAKMVLGAITIHKVTERSIEDDDIKGLLKIVATALAPHFLIGRQLDEKKTMMSGPFKSFMDVLDSEIQKAKEYKGGLSLVYLKFTDFFKRAQEVGVEGADMQVQESGALISRLISKVHVMMRLDQDKLAIIMPLIDKAQALDEVMNAVGTSKSSMKPSLDSVYYPDQGKNALELLHSLIGQLRKDNL